MRKIKSIPEKRLSKPGRMPSDIDGDTEWYYSCARCGCKKYNDKENPYCEDCE